MPGALKQPVELDGVTWIATEDSILVPSVRVVAITIGIQLKSQAGGWSNNWQAAAGRSKQLRTRTMKALQLVSVEAVAEHLQASPQNISFIRLARRTLDSDNLAAVFKPIRDQVCCWLAFQNVANARARDSLRSGYTFSYHQQQQKLYGVRIELSPYGPRAD